MREVISKLFNRSPGGDKAADLDYLTRLVRRFSVEQQQVPKDLSELMALNYIEQVPVPPDGQKFVIDRKVVEVRLE